jgi:hypothetical protein
MVVRDRFWFLFARQRKKNPFPSKMEGKGEVEYLKPISEKKRHSKVEFEAKTTRAKETGVRKKVPPLATRRVSS